MSKDTPRTLKDALTEAIQAALHYLRTGGEHEGLKGRLSMALDELYGHQEPNRDKLPGIRAVIEDAIIALQERPDRSRVEGALKLLDEALAALDAAGIPLQHNRAAESFTVGVEDNREGAKPIREEDTKPSIADERERINFTACGGAPPEDEDKSRGLYDKWEVTRLKDAVGKHQNCKILVLDLDHDKFSLPAAFEYMLHAQKDGYTALAEDIQEELDRREHGLVHTGYEATAALHEIKRRVDKYRRETLEAYNDFGTAVVSDATVTAVNTFTAQIFKIIDPLLGVTSTGTVEREAAEDKGYPRKEPEATPSNPDAMLELGLALVNDIQEAVKGQKFAGSLTEEELNKRFAGLRNLIKDLGEGAALLAKIDGGLDHIPGSILEELEGSFEEVLSVDSESTPGEWREDNLERVRILRGCFAAYKSAPPVLLSAPPMYSLPIETRKREELAATIINELHRGIKGGYFPEQTPAALERLEVLRRLMGEFAEDYTAAQKREHSLEGRLESVIAWLFRRSMTLRTVPTDTPTAFKYLLKLALGIDSVQETLTGAELEGARRFAESETTEEFVRGGVSRIATEEVEEALVDARREASYQLSALNKVFKDLVPDDEEDAKDLEAARQAFAWLRAYFDAPEGARITPLPQGVPPGVLDRIREGIDKAVTAYMAQPLASGSKDKLCSALQDASRALKEATVGVPRMLRFEITEGTHRLETVGAIESINTLHAALWSCEAERAIYASLGFLARIRASVLALDAEAGRADVLGGEIERLQRELEEVNARAVRTNEGYAARLADWLGALEEREQTITALREDNKLLSQASEQQAQAIIAYAFTYNRLRGMVKSALDWHRALQAAVRQAEDGSFRVARPEYEDSTEGEYAVKLLAEIKELARTFAQAGAEELALADKTAPSLLMGIREGLTDWHGIR